MRLETPPDFCHFREVVAAGVCARDSAYYLCIDQYCDMHVLLRPGAFKMSVNVEVGR